MRERWTRMLWGDRAREKREEAARARQEDWREWRIGPGGLWVLAYPSGSAIWFAADGHAGGAQRGADLLCAAASAIWHTLRATAAELAAEGAGRILCDSLHTGRARLCFLPAEGDARAAERFLAIAAGYRALAEAFPYAPEKE